MNASPKQLTGTGSKSAVRETIKRGMWAGSPRYDGGEDLENVRTIIKHGYLTRTDENGLTMYANRKTDKNGENVITWEYSPPLSMPLS